MRQFAITVALLSGFAGSAAAAEEVRDWSGFYVGTTGGWLVANFSDGAGIFARGQGIIAGLSVGVEHQAGPMIFGLDADIALTRVSDIYDAGIVPDGGKASMDVLGGLRGRAGVAFDRAQLFATGGLAIGHVNDVFLVDTDNHWMYGWSVGAGAAYAVTDNIVLEGQYLLSHLGPTYFFSSKLNETVWVHTLTASVKVQVQ